MILALSLLEVKKNPEVNNRIGGRASIFDVCVVPNIRRYCMGPWFLRATVCEVMSVATIDKCLEFNAKSCDEAKKKTKKKNCV